MPKKIDEALGPVMPWLAPPFMHLATEMEAFDPRTVATTMARIERGFRTIEVPSEQATAMLEVAATPEMWRELEFALRDGVGELKRAASRDARYSLVLKLLKRAHERVPCVTLQLLESLEPQSHLRRMCEPVDLLAAAGNSRGEMRARALIRALREVAEMLYEPYLRALWALTELDRGKWPSNPGNFGAVVNACHDRLRESHPGLVDPDAGWLRNAAAHAHWVFDPSSGTVVLWDTKRPPARMRLGELERRVTDMYSIAALTFPFTLLLHALRDVLIPSGLLGLIQEAATTLPFADATRQAELERTLDELASSIFEPLRQFMASQAGPGATSAPAQGE